MASWTSYLLQSAGFFLNRTGFQSNRKAHIASLLREKQFSPSIGTNLIGDFDGSFDLERVEVNSI